MGRINKRKREGIWSYSNKDWFFLSDWEQVHSRDCWINSYSDLAKLIVSILHVISTHYWKINRNFLVYICIELVHVKRGNKHRPKKVGMILKIFFSLVPIWECSEFFFLSFWNSSTEVKWKKKPIILFIIVILYDNLSEESNCVT